MPQCARSTSQIQAIKNIENSLLNINISNLSAESKLIFDLLDGQLVQQNDFIKELKRANQVKSSEIKMSKLRY